MKLNSSKSTILIITVGFLALYFLFNWEWALIVSFLIGVLGVLSNYLSIRIEWVWMKLAKVLQYIIPNILLTIVYYFMLTPLAIISRIFIKDRLMLSKEYTSYFIDVKDDRNEDSLNKIW